MKKSTKIEISKKAKRLFESWDKAGLPEVTYTKKENGEEKECVFHKSKGEEFKESPLLRKKVGRRNLYYISNRGHLIYYSNSHPNNLRLKKIEKGNNGERDRYYIQDSKRGTIYHGTVYRLVADAFGIYVYGLAKEDDDIHHERGYIKEKGLSFNVNPDYMERVTDDVHKALSNLQRTQGRERTFDEEINIMQGLSKIAGKEEPNKISVFWDNPDYTKVETTESVQFRGQASEFMKTLNHDLYNWMHQEDTDNTTDKPKST